MNEHLIHPEIPYEVPEEFRDFLVFYTYVMDKHLKLKPTRIQMDMANFLQDENYGDVLLQAPRKEGKSQLAAIYACWRLYLNPYLTLELISENENGAKKLSRMMKGILKNLDFLTHLAPNKQSLDGVDMWTTGYVPAEVDHPSVKCVGITGGVTGTHAEVIIPDDIETDKNSATQVQREKLRSIVEEIPHVLIQDSPYAKMVWIGTPHTEESLYTSIAATWGVHTRVWPRQYGWVDDNYHGEIAPILRADREANPSLAEGGVFGLGKSTDPQRWPDDRLVKMAHDDAHGRSSWYLQLQLDTRFGLTDVYPLKISDLVVTDIQVDEGPAKVRWSNRTPIKDLHCLGRSGDTWYEAEGVSEDFLPWERKVAFIDVSGRGNDSTACSILFQLNGAIFLYDILQYSQGYDEEQTLIPLCRALAKCGPGEIWMEDNFGDGMFFNLFEPIAAKYCPDWGLYHSDDRGNRERNEVKAKSQQKEARIIDRLEPISAAHRLIINRKAILSDYSCIQQWSAGQASQYSWVYQLSRITRERGCLGHDDALDSMAWGAGLMAEAMRTDQEEGLSQARQAQQIAWVDQYLDEVKDMHKGNTQDESLWAAIGAPLSAF